MAIRILRQRMICFLIYSPPLFLLNLRWNSVPTVINNFIIPSLCFSSAYLQYFNDTKIPKPTVITHPMTALRSGGYLRSVTPVERIHKDRKDHIPDPRICMHKGSYKLSKTWIIRQFLQLYHFSFDGIESMIRPWYKTLLMKCFTLKSFNKNRYLKSEVWVNESLFVFKIIL